MFSHYSLTRSLCVALLLVGSHAHGALRLPRGSGTRSLSETHRAALESKTNAIVDSVKNLHRSLATNAQICDKVEDAIQAETGVSMTCTCSGQVSTGVPATMTCSTNTPLCEDGICGHVDMTFSFNSSGISAINFCVDFVENKYPDICLHVTTPDGGTTFDCEVDINDTRCNECSYCNNNEAVHLDCRNIEEDLFQSDCQQTGGSPVFLPVFDGSTSGASTVAFLSAFLVTVAAVLL